MFLLANCPKGQVARRNCCFFQAKTNNFFIFSRYVHSLAESEQFAYQWMPVSFIILPEQLKSKSETRKKLHAKYTDERNNLMAFSSTFKEKIWIAKSSSGAKGEEHDKKLISYSFFKNSLTSLQITFGCRVVI